jgi:hypothetical protein
MKSKWSKWKPLAVYSYSSREYLMLAKVNRKNGDVKTKSVVMDGRLGYTQTSCFNKTFDANKQLISLLEPSVTSGVE